MRSLLQRLAILGIFVAIVYIVAQGISAFLARDGGGGGNAAEPAARALAGVDPESVPAVISNNLVMSMGLVPNLNGIAIAYDANADRLIDDSGRFRTELTLEQAASLMKVEASAIASRDSPPTLDPNAELFRAQVGTLTEAAKVKSLQFREQQSGAGKIPYGVVADWNVVVHSFSLATLKNPTPHEKMVLDAVIRAKTGVIPGKGDKVRATGVDRGDLSDGKMALTAGMLPVEAVANE
jgi:hypothetical protein